MKLILSLLLNIILCVIIVYLITKRKHEKNIDEKFLSLISQPITVEKNYKKRHNICIVTLETRNLNITDIHNNNVKNYALKHGYTYIFLKDYKDIDKDLELPVYWKKIQIVKTLLPQYEYVLWMDSDSIFAHPEIRIEAMIHKCPEKSIFIAKDFPNKQQNVFCAGVFLVKNDKDGLGFLEDCLYDYINNPKCKEDNKYGLHGLYAGECYEQGVMNKLLTEKYKYRFCHLSPEYIINSGYPAFGSFIAHIWDSDSNKKNTLLHFQYFLRNHIEMIPLEPNNLSPSICVILTMYSINKERIDLYRENVYKWIKTGLPIFSVDSNDENGDKLQIKRQQNYFPYYFQQKPEEDHLNNSSILETASLKRVFNVFPELSNFKIIFKITGKYFLPKFTDMIKYFPYDSDIIVQNQNTTHGQNCEIFGSKYEIFKNIINHPSIIKSNTPLEVVLREFSKNKKYKSYRMRPLKPEKKVKRGDGNQLEFL